MGASVCVCMRHRLAGPSWEPWAISPGGVRDLDMGTAMLGLRVRTRRVAKLSVLG